jgi:hypothetical protein
MVVRLPVALLNLFGKKDHVGRQPPYCNTRARVTISADGQTGQPIGCKIIDSHNRKLIAWREIMGAFLDIVRAALAHHAANDCRRGPGVEWRCMSGRGLGDVMGWSTFMRLIRPVTAAQPGTENLPAACAGMSGLGMANHEIRY